jgi:hypothetical protein
MRSVIESKMSKKTTSQNLDAEITGGNTERAQSLFLSKLG